MTKTRKKYTKKRPMWQWFLLYMFLGLLIILAILSIRTSEIYQNSNADIKEKETIYFE